MPNFTGYEPNNSRSADTTDVALLDHLVTMASTKLEPYTKAVLADVLAFKHWAAVFLNEAQLSGIKGYFLDDNYLPPRVVAFARNTLGAEAERLSMTKYPIPDNASATAIDKVKLQRLELPTRARDEVCSWVRL